MLFPTPLVRGTLVRRYKRFLSDIVLDDGRAVTAHVANSGAMTGLSEPGLEVWLSEHDNPARKLRWSWELAGLPGGLVGINTGWPNAVVAEAIAAGRVPELTGYPALRREVRYGKASRCDLLLEAPDRPTCWVEVKNVHLKRGPAAAFPDAVTARGTKHLGELRAMAAEGARAVMFFLVQRQDCDYFTVAADVDPAYAAALEHAMAGGVEVLCYTCALSLSGIVLDRPLPIRL